MKITKFVTFEQEVEVNVSAEQCADAIHADPERLQTCQIGLNNCARFMKAIPDTVIGEMTPAVQKAIRDFLTSQALRYSK